MHLISLEEAAQHWLAAQIEAGQIHPASSLCDLEPAELVQEYLAHREAALERLRQRHDDA